MNANQSGVDPKPVQDKQGAGEILFKERRQVQRPFPQPEVVEGDDAAWDMWQKLTSNTSDSH